MPPAAGVATSELGARIPVVILVVLLSLVPAIPMLGCFYIWFRATLKAIRAAEDGDVAKSKDIVTALASALSTLPPSLGGTPTQGEQQAGSDDEGSHNRSNAKP